MKRGHFRMGIEQPQEIGQPQELQPLQVGYASQKANAERARHHNFLFLFLSGCVLELLYLLLLALVPLPELHLSASPLVDAWPWTLWLSHILFSGAWHAGAIADQQWTYILLLGAVLIVMGVIYGFAVGRALRIRNVSGLWVLVPLLGAIVFGLTLLLQPRLFSNDVFNYIFSGRLLAIYHADPMNTAPIQFVDDPYLPWIAQANFPTIYGPLSLLIASVLVRVSDGPVATLLLFKGVALFSHLVNTLLVWSILTKIAPTRRFPGTLLYAWNPLLLIELAGSGHNEGVFLALLLLATWLHVYVKAGRYEIGVLILFGLAVSVNLIALLVAPLYIWFLGRTERDVRRVAWDFCWRMLLVLAIMLLMYLPFWRGAPTFLAITSAADMEHYVHSPLGPLVYPLRWLFSLIAQWLNFPAVMQPVSAADLTLRASTIFIFALIYFNLFSRVRHATTTMSGMHYDPKADHQMNLPGFDVLLSSWGLAVLGYILLVSGWFWPWYLLWMLWAMTLRRFDRFTTSIFLLSCTVLLTYPLLNFAASPLAEYQAVLIFGIPLVYWVGSKKRRLERNRIA